MTAAPLPTKRILLIDDEPQVLQLMELSLRGLGVQVHTVTDGQAALDWLQANVPDLVVLDVMMPKVSGLTIYHSMLADERLKSVPVLVVSVVYPDETLIRHSLLSSLPTLPKPFSPIAFAARVREMLGLPR